MGQRLDIEIYKDAMSFLYANCYYHWSAYTMDSLLKVKDIINQWESIKNDPEKTKDELLLGYHLLCIDDATFDIDESVPKYKEDGTRNYAFKTVVKCAGLCEQSFRLMKLLFPKEEFKKAVDRNVGLISIHPNDVQSTRDWEEGRVNIDLDAEEFSFDLWWSEDGESMKEWYDGKLEDIPTFPTDLEHKLLWEYVSFKDIDTLIEIVHNSDFYKLSDGTYLSWIQ